MGRGKWERYCRCDRVKIEVDGIQTARSGRQHVCSNSTYDGWIRKDEIKSDTKK